MKIAFLGDIALIGKYDVSVYGKDQVFRRLEKVKSVLEQCDFVVGNLESPLTDLKKTREAKTLPLRTDSINVAVLKYLKVSAVSMANNHIFDYGINGMRDCMNVLKENGISCFGIGGENCVLEKHGISIELIGYCCRTTNAWHYSDNYEQNTLDELVVENVVNRVNGIIMENRIPIVFCHWGDENTHYPKKEHIEISDAIHSKCDQATIIGHHPHMIQGLKEYANGNTFFSLGNFLFDDCESTNGSGVKVKQVDDNRKGAIVVIDIKANGVLKYEMIPIVDTGCGIEFDNSILEEVEKYSWYIQNTIDWYQYEERRRTEMRTANQSRLGKRGILWIIGHMNRKAVCAVLQRKKNQKVFRHYMMTPNMQQYRIKDLMNFDKNDKIVVYVGNFGRPENNAAGKRVYGNARLLEALGYRVIMIGKSNSDIYDESSYGENIYYYSFPTIRRLDVKSYMKWFNDFLHNKNVSPTYIVRYGSPGVAWFDFLLWKYAKREKITLLVDVVDWLNADSSNLLFNIVKTMDIWFEKAMFNKMGNGVIAISSYLEKYYKRYKHCLVLPPLVTEYEMSYEEHDTIDVVYAGMPFRKGMKVKNVHRIKDRLDLVVTAFAKVVANNPKVFLHVYGLTKEEYLIAFPKHKEMVASENILFYGMQPMKTVKESIKRKDFTILLREKNRATMAGFPTKIVESLSLGTPVITTDTTDLKRYITEGKNGFFVDVKNEDILISAIESIVLQPKSKIRYMKQMCYEEKKFEYKEYLDAGRKFMENVR